MLSEELKNSLKFLLKNSLFTLGASGVKYVASLWGLTSFMLLIMNTKPNKVELEIMENAAIETLAGAIIICSTSNTLYLLSRLYVYCRNCAHQAPEAGARENFLDAERYERLEGEEAELGAEGKEEAEPGAEGKEEAEPGAEQREGADFSHARRLAAINRKVVENRHIKITAGLSLFTVELIGKLALSSYNQNVSKNDSWLDYLMWAVLLPMVTGGELLAISCICYCFHNCYKNICANHGARPINNNEGERDVIVNELNDERAEGVELNVAEGVDAEGVELNHVHFNV